MSNIAHVDQSCQAQFNFDLLINPDNINYFHLLPAGELPHGDAGDVLIPTRNIPRGDLVAWARPSLFDAYPMMRDRRRKATLVRPPYLRPDSNGIADIGMIVITWPLDDEDPGPVSHFSPGHEQAKVIEIRPALDKKANEVKDIKPPEDVVNCILRHNPPRSVIKINAALFTLSWCGSSEGLLNWHEKNHRKSRWSHPGIEGLEDTSGYEGRQVRRALAWLEKRNFIYLIHQGWKGEGNSEYELPKDMVTVNIFRFKKGKKTHRKKLPPHLTHNR